jgi:hypothetical protein
VPAGEGEGWLVVLGGGMLEYVWLGCEGVGWMRVGREEKEEGGELLWLLVVRTIWLLSGMAWFQHWMNRFRMVWCAGGWV